MSITEEAIGITKAKTTLPAVVRRLTSGEQARAVLFRRNTPVAVILPIEAYERLERLEADLEHLEDAMALAKAASVNDGTTWSVEEVKDKLGLTG